MTRMTRALDHMTCYCCLCFTAGPVCSKSVPATLLKPRPAPPGGHTPLTLAAGAGADGVLGAVFGRRPAPLDTHPRLGHDQAQPVSAAGAVGIGGQQFVCKWVYVHVQGISSRVCP